MNDRVTPRDRTANRVGVGDVAIFAISGPTFPGDLARIRTSWPAAESARTEWLPMKPVPPVTSTFIADQASPSANINSRR